LNHLEIPVNAVLALVPFLMLIPFGESQKLREHPQLNKKDFQLYFSVKNQFLAKNQDL